MILRSALGPFGFALRYSCCSTPVFRQGTGTVVIDLSFSWCDDDFGAICSGSTDLGGFTTLDD